MRWEGINFEKFRYLIEELTVEFHNNNSGLVFYAKKKKEEKTQDLS